MSVTLGINPITWTHDDMPELGGDIPLDTCFAEARAAGYAGIELGGKFRRLQSALRPDPSRAVRRDTRRRNRPAGNAGATAD